MSAIPVLTPAQARAWDAASEAAGRSLRMLMESAGRAVAGAVLARYAVEARQGVLVACGTGNNGGDGWVAARTLHLAGVPVWVVSTGSSGGLAAEAERDARRDGVRTVPVDGPWPGVSLVVDALLGTGAVGAPRPPMDALLTRLLDLDAPIVAVDGPTGLDLGTGVHHGTLRASLTITFGGPRRGHLLARDDVGDLIVAEIGLVGADPEWPRLMHTAWAARTLAPFSARSHKGDRGRVVIVGGMPEMSGAVRLTARAAFAAGAGLVHMAAPEATLTTLRLAEPDVQTVVQEFSGSLAEDTRALVERSDVVIIGPGLGRDGSRASLVAEVLGAARAAVVDADALVALKDRREDLATLASARPIVLTPHVGEFRTLFPANAGELETSPWEAAEGAANASGATVLLKGVPTVVCSPDGARVTVAAGNPGLATGGSGDVLSGVIGALMAQGLGGTEAASVAAQAHGEAADQAARRVTARAMRPMDVVSALPEIWRRWARERSAPEMTSSLLLELPRPRGE